MFKNAVCKLFCILSLLIPNSVWGQGRSPRPQVRPPERPRVTYSGGRANIQLGQGITNALQAHDNTFRMLNNSQFSETITWYGTPNNSARQAVVADFNKDGRPDSAVMGISQGNSVVVYAALSTSTPGQYTVQEVHRWPCREDSERGLPSGNLCRQMATSPPRYAIRDWPYYLLVADNESERNYTGVNIGVDHLQWQSTGTQERLYIYNNRTRNLQAALRRGAGRGANSADAATQDTSP